MFITFYKTREKKRNYYIHSPTPALTLSLTLTLNHLANEALQTGTTQHGLMYLTYGCATRIIPSEARLYLGSIEIFRRRRLPEVGLKTSISQEWFAGCEFLSDAPFSNLVSAPKFMTRTAHAWIGGAKP